MNELLINVRRACEILGVSKLILSRLVADGSLPVAYLTERRRLRFRYEDLARLVRHKGTASVCLQRPNCPLNERLITRREVMRIVGVSKNRVDRFVAEGQLPVAWVTPTGLRRFRIADAKLLVNAGRRRGRRPNGIFM